MCHLCANSAKLTQIQPALDQELDGRKPVDSKALSLSDQVPILVCTQGVRGSNPLVSTRKLPI